MATGKNADGEWVNPQEEIGIPREPQSAPSVVEDHGTEDHCPKSPTGKHKVDMGAKGSVILHDATSWILDVWCKHCGRSGSFLITPQAETNW